ncbi:unnamed protein product [Notodromas monacha]|uniref:Uncharacterized protein n=1 Tax=Notodromas monacha TaxID=399045 RepID=A0A7R9GCD6_9CRUS|nr:unnamed protein product [Notodromas monacha]CAG0917315.1 unnamed protein product [Notodromas monacha]
MVDREAIMEEEELITDGPHMLEAILDLWDMEAIMVDTIMDTTILGMGTLGEVTAGDSAVLEEAITEITATMDLEDSGDLSVLEDPVVLIAVSVVRREGMDSAASSIGSMLSESLRKMIQKAEVIAERDTDSDASIDLEDIVDGEDCSSEDDVDEYFVSRFFAADTDQSSSLMAKASEVNEQEGVLSGCGIVGCKFCLEIEDLARRSRENFLRSKFEYSSVVDSSQAPVVRLERCSDADLLVSRLDFRFRKERRNVAQLDEGNCVQENASVDMNLVREKVIEQNPVTTRSSVLFVENPTSVLGAPSPPRNSMDTLEQTTSNAKSAMKVSSSPLEKKPRFLPIKFDFGSGSLKSEISESKSISPMSRLKSERVEPIIPVDLWKSRQESDDELENYDIRNSSPVSSNASSANLFDNHGRQPERALPTCSFEEEEEMVQLTLWFGEPNVTSVTNEPLEKVRKEPRRKALSEVQIRPGKRPKLPIRRRALYEHDDVDFDVYLRQRF